MAVFLETLHSPHLVAFAVKLPIVIPLILACLAILVLIPLAASRGKYHIPGYAGIALLASLIALLFGRTAGAQGIAGSVTGIFLSIVFFLLIAVAVGAILALFCHRHPPGA